MTVCRGRGPMLATHYATMRRGPMLATHDAGPGHATMDSATNHGCPCRHRTMQCNRLHTPVVDVEDTPVAEVEASAPLVAASVITPVPEQEIC